MIMYYRNKFNDGVTDMTISFSLFFVVYPYGKLHGSSGLPPLQSQPRLQAYSLFCKKSNHLHRICYLEDSIRVTQSMF